MNKLLHLHTETTSLVIKADKTLPEMLYWGKRLPEGTDLDTFFAANHHPVPQARIDTDTVVSLCPEHARGLFTAPGLEGCRNGDNWSPEFTLEETVLNGQQVSFLCRDRLAALKLDIHLSLNLKSHVLSTHLELTNEGNSNYQLHKLTNTLLLPTIAREIMYFHGRWTHEFQTERKKLDRSGFILENRRGRTSHEHFPGIMIGQANFSETAGKVYGFHLAWSANHRFHAEAMSDGRRYLQAGELLMPGEVELIPGESYRTPTLYSTYSNKGLNGISQNFHRHVRNEIVRFPEPQKVRPVHLNTWEGIYFNHDPEYIMKMVRSSAEIGVERFIIDDGWFRSRNDDKAALGDWYLDEKKYPNGLQPIINCVKEHGMEFGLWFEPEMISPDSDLYRAHPEWMLHTEGYEQVTIRNQYVLNLQIPEAFDYVLDRLDNMLTGYDIRYIKWDMNRELVQPTNNCRAAFHGHVEAYYRLVDEVRRRHPMVEIETCSGGGGRVDFEILKRTQRFWASDCNDALERQTIQRGASYFFPLEITGAHIGAKLCHTTGRQHNADFRGITALFGHMGVELDPVRACEEEKRGFARYISLYKSLRQLLYTGDFFRYDTAHRESQAWGVVSLDQREAVVMFAQMDMPEYAMSAPLPIPGLNQTKDYKVRVLENSSSNIYMKQCPPWMTEPAIMSAALLEQVGLMMPVMQPESALLIQISQV
ncbi:alpha-galactosidase [Endozoicomonas sp. SCSIO W0465]|uniref:alpha-galactosidase n=1 Tax=Endozoicomonas sp. SCSIO W0465 TaxID=2918516 RepID=UPI002075226A|nr:alpha-galactosidase [Endozoicomonas sp. SCSIO W0465]USE37603.1 alpha-galactosidase [Endozoicomonas sp. SCSIO W0465]